MGAPQAGRTVRTILSAGVAAGVFDIVAAMLVYGQRGARPMRILQSIASGLLGPAAFQGGTATAAAGLVLHFFIAGAAAAVFYLASLRIHALVRRPVAFGALYGVVVYAFMNFVVLPLSAVAKRPFDARTALLIVLVHIVCVGVPIALIVRRGRNREE